MNQTNTEQIIYQLENHLYPSFGELQTFEISSQNRLIFSEITKVTLSYPQATKKVVLKRLLAQNRKANLDLSLLVEREYQVLNYLYDRFSSLQKINVIRPLAVFSKDSVLVTENFPGDKLDALILENLRFFPTRKKLTTFINHTFLCGRWLKHFHDFTTQDEAVTLEKTSFIANLNDMLRVDERCELNEIVRRRIYKFVTEKFSTLDKQQLKLVGYHSDFTPWNILIKDDELRVLDFDRFSHRCKYEDLTLFICCLDTIKSVLGIFVKTIDTLKNAFLEGYGTEDINKNILQLYILKNTIKCLNMIDVSKIANIRYLDKKYERFRKKREIKTLLFNLGQLLNGKYLLNLL
jgi:hypothetical protein